jgi:hypothetical protein
MEDYYPAELPSILRAWADIRGTARADGGEDVDPMTFFGTGGERIDG